MIVTNRGSVFRLVLWQWKYSLLFLVAGTAAAVAHEILSLTYLTLPMAPLAIAGGAMGIFVSFRTNSAYDRWWEGRKLWGRLINTSRHWCTQVMTYVHASSSPDEARAMIERHIVYVNVMRVGLRQQKLSDDEELKRLLPSAELQTLETESSPTHALLQAQMDQARGLLDRGTIDHFWMSDLDASVRHLLDIQGGCERIKKTPMPRGYGFVADRLIIAFGLLFPFAVVGELGWAAIPTNLFVGLAFALISEAGRVIEDPFTMFWNGLPLSAISRMIEVNLRQRLGDTELPPLLEPNRKGILM